MIASPLPARAFKKLKDNLLRISSLIKVVHTVRTVDAAGDATYSNPINMLERYLDDNVNLARIYALYTWGDRSFMIMATNTVEDLTAANGF
jgi:hypothetical protein